MILQFPRLERIKQSSIAVAVPRDRCPIAARPYVVLRVRPPPWPDCIIGSARRGDTRSPLERWISWHMDFEAHFHG